METAITIGPVLVAVIGALGIRELWPFVFKYLQGRQSSNQKAAKAERQEYSEGWRGVCEQLRNDLTAEKEDRKRDQEEIRDLRLQVGKCEKRDGKRARLLIRTIDRIRELTEVLKTSGIKITTWTLNDKDVEDALSNNGPGVHDDSPEDEEGGAS